MRTLATPEALLHRWEEMQRDPSLQDLPYKIELNSWGKVEMSPASNRHGRLQAFIAAEFLRQLPDGVAISECSRIGIRVPEICVEIISPSNVQAEIDERTNAYLEAGALEVRLVAEAGSIRYFDARGEKAASSFPVALHLPPPIKGTP